MSVEMEGDTPMLDMLSGDTISPKEPESSSVSPILESDVSDEGFIEVW